MTPEETRIARHHDYFRVKTTREPDKAAIKEAIESGAEVPGAALEERFSATIRRTK